MVSLKPVAPGARLSRLQRVILQFAADQAPERSAKRNRLLSAPRGPWSAPLWLPPDATIAEIVLAYTGREADSRSREYRTASAAVCRAVARLITRGLLARNAVARGVNVTALGERTIARKRLTTTRNRKSLTVIAQEKNTRVLRQCQDGRVMNVASIGKGKRT